MISSSITQMKNNLSPSLCLLSFFNSSPPSASVKWLFGGGINKVTDTLLAGHFVNVTAACSGFLRPQDFSPAKEMSRYQTGC